MPVDTGVAPVARGRTWYGPEATIPSSTTGWGTNVELEGRPHVFQDFDPSASPQLTKRSQNGVKCLLVRNTSAITLFAGDAVTWQSGYRGKRVDGKVCINGQEVAGLVDDFLPTAGVRANDLFWLIVDGNCLVRTNMSNANTGTMADGLLNNGNILYALTAATSQQTGTTATCGKLTSITALNAATTWTATQTTDSTLAFIMFNRCARAMTARTTANTGGLSTGTMLVNFKGTIY